MKKQNKMKTTLFVTACLACVALTFIAITAVTGQNSSLQNSNTQTQSQDDERVLTDALKRGGLREAARIKGHYVDTYGSPHTEMFENVGELASLSEVIIVGTPTQNRTQLSQNGQMIYTNYKVTVQTPIKGNVEVGDTVIVSLPGGRVSWDNGTIAEIKTPDVPKMVNGRAYVLFLNKFGQEENVFLPLEKGQGMFEIATGGLKIKPLGRDITPLVKRNKDKDVTDFLKDIRKAVNDNQTSNCCE